MMARSDPMLAHEFVQFSVATGVLRFGEFKTKAGRLSPYFFNAGLFDDGTKLARLAEFYARRLLADPLVKPLADSSANAQANAVADANAASPLPLDMPLDMPFDLPFDMLFGPAYKGITLAAALAMELARRGHSRPFAFNRKEAKDHGEGGLLVGAPMVGRVLIVDDVMSAGTSVRESVALITSAGARPCGVVIALDRQERASEAGQDAPWSAVQFVTQQLGLPVAAVATLDDLLTYLRNAEDPSLVGHTAAVLAYRDRYGV